MWSKNHRSKTDAERRHLEAVKELPCSVCEAPGPSEAHHMKQQDHWTAIALCADCHRGSFAGWHGQRRAWAVRKLDELGALSITLRGLYGP